MSRLQLATRIHKLLLREIGHDIEVDRLLDDPRYARDVLLVCDALPGDELAPLANLFRATTLSAAGPRRPSGPPGHAPQANAWGRDTSGFGLSQPPPVDTWPGPLADAADPDAPPAEGERRRGWLPRWPRRSK